MQCAVQTDALCICVCIYYIRLYAKEKRKTLRKVHPETQNPLSYLQSSNSYFVVSFLCRFQFSATNNELQQFSQILINSDWHQWHPTNFLFVYIFIYQMFRYLLKFFLFYYLLNLRRNINNVRLRIFSQIHFIIISCYVKFYNLFLIKNYKTFYV